MVRKIEKLDEERLLIIAKKILEPLYGVQDNAVNQWITGKRHKMSFVSINKQGEIDGVLIVKNNPEKDYLKISTLLVLDGYKGKGIGRKLLEFAQNIATENGFKKIIVTVSEKVEVSIKFFGKNDFDIIDCIFEKYQENTFEYILQKDL